MAFLRLEAAYGLVNYFTSHILDEVIDQKFLKIRMVVQTSAEDLSPIARIICIEAQKTQLRERQRHCIVQKTKDNSHSFFLASTR